MKKLLGLWVVVLLGCEVPPVEPGADKRQNQSLSRLEGTAVFSGPARGNVILFLFDAKRPPPPLGFGRPVTFSVLPKAKVFGAASANDVGPFAADFAFSGLTPGNYSVTGFVDANEDFVPFYGVTAEPNTGDQRGASLEATGALRTFEVTAKGPTLGVPAGFSPVGAVTLDRPVFESTGPSPQLGATPLVIPLVPRAIEVGAVHQPNPVFLVKAIDDNKDGQADDANKDGVPDFWPKVVVRKLSDSSVLLDENDLDHNGVPDDTGADYAHVDPATGAMIAPDGKPDVVVLAAGINPMPLAPLLFEANGTVKATPMPTSQLQVVVKPLALDARDPAAPVPLAAVPKGRYSVTLIQLTGQTWKVPNELSAGIAENLGLPTVETQSFVITVP